jgi:hypothetical protein
MTTTTKGIPSAIVKYVFRRYDEHPGEERQSIDALKIFTAIAPYLPGEWRVISKIHNEVPKLPDLIICATFERESDGVRIMIGGGTCGEGRNKIEVCAASHRHDAHSERSDTISWRQISQQALPSAHIDITKRNAKAIAGDVVRRVVTPCAEAMPKVRELQAARARQNDAADKAHQTILHSKGVTIRNSYHGDSTRWLEFGDGIHVDARISDRETNVRIDRLTLPAEAIEDFAALLRKYLGKEAQS